MRKIYALMTAMLALFAINANAERVLFQETYETGGIPTTWTVNGSASIQSTDESSFLQIVNGNATGARSANNFWGTSIFTGVTETTYSLSFELKFNNLDTNKYDGEIAVFADEGKCMMGNGSLEGKGKDWDPYAVRTNCLFSLYQTQNADNKTKWMINPTKNSEGTALESSKVLTVNAGAAGTWYLVTLTVNTTTKEVSYEIFNYDSQKAEATGIKTMDAEASIYATGIYLNTQRYNGSYSIDNLKVFLDMDYANKPVIALTGINNTERTYTITFLEGETLHVKGTDGLTQTISYDDVDEGNYIYKTTQSGTITAWTTAGDMTSEEVTAEVNCEPIVIPEPASAIVAASDGYAKTYQFTIDRTAILLQPEVFMDFSFKSADGSADFELPNQNNGVKVNIPARGKLTIKTKASGYAEGTYTLMNDQEFEVKQTIDFQNMSKDQLTAMGFQDMEDLNTETMSGENNWTGRLRLYCDILTGEKDGEGNPLYNRIRVYGPTELTDAEGAKTPSGAEPIKRMQFLQSGLTKEKAYSLFAPLYIWYGTIGIKSPSQYFDNYDAETNSGTPKEITNKNQVTTISGTTNPKMYLGLGLCYSGSLNDEGSFDPSGVGYGQILIEDAPIGIDGLTDEDFIVKYTITDYGTTSLHPVYPQGTSVDDAKAQYKASVLGDNTAVYKGTETFTLHRVDEVLNRVVILTPKGASGIKTVNYNKIVTDHNAPFFNLNGVRVDGSALQKGIYIQQGRKFVVK